MQRTPISDFERQVYNWNVDNPIDRYYRNKYNIRFNSPEHRDCCLIDMLFEYLEDIIFEQKESEYKKGDFLKEQKVELPSDEQLMQLFTDQNVSNLDDPKQ